MINIKSKRKRILITIMGIFIIICTMCTIFILNSPKTLHSIKEKTDLMGECVPVLTYHAFVPKEIKQSQFSDNVVVDSIENFELQMKYLNDNGWTTLTADEFYKWHEGDLEIPEKSVLITFDDGYYEMYHLIYPILKKYNFNAISFVVGSYTPNTTAPYDPSLRSMIGWDKIKEIQHDYPGFQFESHSYDLHDYYEYDAYPCQVATENQLRQDFDKMDAYGFEYMAYPYGEYNDLVLDIVNDSKIKMAFAFKTPGYATKRSDIYRIPRQKVNAATTYDEFKEILEKTL